MISDICIFDGLNIVKHWFEPETMLKPLNLPLTHG